MPKLFRFTHFSLRDFILTAGPALVLGLAAIVLAFWWIDPFPPRTLVLSTGQPNSAYEHLGKQYADALAGQGIKLILKPSSGSLENLRRLRDDASGIDAAFVQSGSAHASDADAEGLLSLGSLFMEPVWIFYRSDLALARLADLQGRRINIGQEGTGVPLLFHRLLELNGIAAGTMQLHHFDNTPATVALLDGKIDAVMFSASADDLLVQMLLQTPGIGLFNVEQADAYARRLPFLTAVRLPRGIVDLGKDIPAQETQLVAPVATLVVKDSTHPALTELLVQAASDIHRRPGWFHREGEFPQARYTELPVAREAQRFYEQGPPFFQRYLPYWMATLFGRMWVVLLALGALLLPLMRIVPPLYVWKVRSRIYRWYGLLRKVEQSIADIEPDERRRIAPEQLRRLDEIEMRVNQISIPLAFAEELYRLRSHIQFVRHRLLEPVQQERSLRE